MSKQQRPRWQLINVRVPLDMARSLEALADLNGRTLSNLVRRALTAYIVSPEECERLIVGLPIDPPSYEVRDPEPPGLAADPPDSSS